MYLDFCSDFLSGCLHHMPAKLRPRVARSKTGMYVPSPYRRDGPPASNMRLAMRVMKRDIATAVPSRAASHILMNPNPQSTSQPHLLPKKQYCNKHMPNPEVDTKISRICKIRIQTTLLQQTGISPRSSRGRSPSPVVQMSVICRPMSSGISSSMC